MKTFSMEFLQQVFDSGERIYPRTELYNFIIERTSFLPKNALPKQRLWHILKNTNEIPGCKMCGKQVKWNSAAKIINQEYRMYCSSKCQQNDPVNKDKKRNTELNRYGKGRKQLVEKTKTTNRKKYGVDFAIQNNTYKEKRKQTFKQKYNVENVIQSEKIKKKRVETNIKRFGVKAPAQSVFIQDKIKKTCVEKYGSIEKRYTHSTKTLKYNCLQKYDVESYNQKHITKDTLEKLNNKQWLINEHVNNKRNLREISEDLNIHQSTLGRYMKDHGISVQVFHSSSFERHVMQNLLEHNIDNVILNERSILENKQELDIYIPSYNIAIELNGIYWHSELQGKNKHYHLNKTHQCSQKNIRLIHIFENEWIHKQDIVKSRISNLLGQNKTIYARKCQIVNVTTSTERLFLDNTHIQGARPSSIALGLTYNDELVSIMTFGKSRYNKNYQYELIRFSSKLDTSVVGGASKLFKHFLKIYDPNSIISYADKRWNTGNVYTQLGFEFSHNSDPNYYYFHFTEPNTLYSRVNFQKHKLSKKLETFDPCLTEWENMQLNGYDRIWDCGNAVYVWRN